MTSNQSEIDRFYTLSDNDKELLGREYLKWTNKFQISSSPMANRTVKEYFNFPSLFKRKEPVSNADAWVYFRKNFPKAPFRSLLQHISQREDRSVYLLARWLHNAAPDAFLEACKDLNYSFTPTLTPAQTVALEIYSGITDSQRILINRYFRAFTNQRSIMAPNHKCLEYKRANDLNPTEAKLDTVLESTEIPEYTKEKTYSYFVKSVKSIVINHLNLQCDAHPKVPLGRYIKKYGKCIPITISGDFGDEDMKVAAIISATKGSGQKSSYTISSYKNKESYDYLSRLIFPKIDEEIKYLKQKTVLVVPTSERNYAFSIVPIEWSRKLDDVQLVKNSKNYVIGVKLLDEEILFENNRSLPLGSVLPDQVVALPFAFFASGDLSYLFLLQRRKTYCTANCYCCKSKRKDWIEGKSGAAITQQEIQRLAALKNPEENYGFNCLQCLLPSIQIENWIIPILHIELGLVELLVRELFTFAYKNLESPPKSIQDLRERRVVVEKEIQLLQEMLNQARKKRKTSTIGGSSESIKRQKANDGKVVQQPATILEELSVPEIEGLIAERKKIITAIKNEEESIWNRCSLPIKDAIKNILAKNGIVQQQYFGGNSMIGKHCQRFLLNHKSILCEIHKLFSENSKNSSFPQEQIDEFIISFTKICELLDAIFYFLFRCDVTATDNECNDFEMLCKEFGDEWRSFFNNEHITPKFHLLEVHAVTQLRKFGSLGEFTEESVERLHHNYKKLYKIYSSCPNAGAQYKLIEGRLNLSHTVSYNCIINQVIQNTRRPRSLVNRPSARDLSKEDRIKMVNKTIESYKNNVVDNLSLKIGEFFET